MATQRELERMSAEELGQWMVDQGYGEEVREAFISKLFYNLKPYSLEISSVHLMQPYNCP